MKILLPIVLALLGLGAGVGAGLAFRPPAPDEAAAEAHPCAPDAHAAAGEAGPGEPADGHAEATGAEDACIAEADDPFDHAGKPAHDPDLHLTYVPIEKPFIVPVFAKEKITAMVVLSLSVETDEKQSELVAAMQPRLRDRFLQVMFRHANSGGFDGSFTEGRRMDDLRSGLLSAAREVMADAFVGDVLITEIARQDV
jgi:hypothetical protein